MFAIALNSPAVFLSICMRLHLCACRLLGRIYAPDDIVVVALLPRRIYSIVNERIQFN